MHINGCNKHHKPEEETPKVQRSAIRTDVKRAHSQAQQLEWHEWHSIRRDQRHRR